MTRSFVSLILVCASFVLAPLTATAGPITVPTGLHPGDHYRLVFVTSTGRNAASGSISSYNDFVTNVANTVPELAALNTTWRAIGSTPETDARDNTSTNPLLGIGFRIYDLNGYIISFSNNSFWDPNGHNRPIERTETGDIRESDTSVWTGTNNKERPPNNFPCSGRMIP